MQSPKDKDTPALPAETSQHDEALDSLGIVVGEIANDFNNILSLILGYVEMALSELPEGSRARSDLEHVLAASDRATELVARILTFSKSTKLMREPIVLDEIATKLGKYLRERLPSNVKINCKIEEGKGRKLLSNETEIYKLLNNLCLNGIQALKEVGGEINLTLDYVDGDSDFVLQHSGLSNRDYARLTVEDNGSGMDIDTIEKMYTPFFTTSRGGDSGEIRAGLGLTTVYNIVSSHDGSIFVESKQGEGSKFVICLPLMDSAVLDDDQEALKPPKKDEHKHILFVDDEESIVRMANKMLVQNGFAVTKFTDGNAALEHFRQQPHQFDLIITDLIMPTITGTELASKLSAINPNVPIVLTTGFSERITSSTCQQWGISTVINKPFTIRDLLATIESLI